MRNSNLIKKNRLRPKAVHIAVAAAFVAGITASAPAVATQGAGEDTTSGPVVIKEPGEHGLDNGTYVLDESHEDHDAALAIKTQTPPLTGSTFELLGDKVTLLVKPNTEESKRGTARGFEIQITPPVSEDSDVKDVEVTTIVNPQLTIVMESSKNSTPTSALGEGIVLTAEGIGTDAHPIFTQKTIFKKPVSIVMVSKTMNNVATLKDSTEPLRKSVIGLRLQGSEGGRHIVEFEEDLAINAVAEQAAPAVGVLMLYPKKSIDSGTHLHFAKSASILATAEETTATTEQGEKINFNTYALYGELYGEKDYPLPSGGGKDKQYMRTVSSGKGSNVHFKAESQNDGTAMGFRQSLMLNSSLLLDMNGKTTYEAISKNANSDAIGLNIYNNCEIKVHHEEAKFASKAGGIARGEDYAVSNNSSAVIEHGQATYYVDGQKSSYGIKYYASDISSIQATWHKDVEVTQVSQSEKDRGAAIKTETMNFSTHDDNAPITSIKMDFLGKLDIKADGRGIDLSSRKRTTNSVTAHGPTTINAVNDEAACMVRNMDSSKSNTTLTFTDSINLRANNLFLAEGSGAEIVVNDEKKAQRRLSGTSRAACGGVVSLSLSGADNSMEMDAHCYVEPLTRNLREREKKQAQLGKVNISLKDNAKWFVKNSTIAARPDPSTITKSVSGATSNPDLSSITMLELNSRGMVDLTTLSGSMQPTETSCTALEMSELKGDGGIFKLNADTSKGTSQMIVIKESSGEGTHYIQASDLSATTAKAEAPILVVNSKDGEIRSADYQARFEAIDPIRIGELGYLVGNEEMIKSAGVETTDSDGNRKPFADPDGNPNNWYLYLDAVPEFNDPAKGGFEIFGAHHLAGMATEEMLRDRLGDVHRFMELQQDTTPWVKAAARGWKARKLTGLSGAKYDVESVKLGIDKRMDVRNLAGAYFGYDRIATRSTDPAKVRMHAWEGGLYWTHLADNQAYWDAIARYGHSRSRMTVGGAQPDRASGVTGEYFGLSLEAGRRFELNEDWRVEPKAKASYTRFSSMTMVTDQGLKARMGGYDSLTTRIGSTLERGFKTKEGTPWNLYGKAFFEREWLADPDVVFNGASRYGVDFKGNRFVYGLGADGEWRNGATWHLGVERSAGGHFEEKWRVDANLRIPF